MKNEIMESETISSEEEKKSAAQTHKKWRKPKWTISLMNWFGDSSDDRKWEEEKY